MLTIPQDQVTGLSRGFGFVHFPTAAQAQAGLVALNNTDLAGRHIYVRVRAAKSASISPGTRAWPRLWPDHAARQSDSRFVHTHLELQLVRWWKG